MYRKNGGNMKFKIIFCVFVTFVYVCLLGFKSSELFGNEKDYEVYIPSLDTTIELNNVVDTSEEIVNDDEKEVTVIDTYKNRNIELDAIDMNSKPESKIDDTITQDYIEFEEKTEIDKNQYEVKQVLKVLNINSEYCVYDLFDANSKDVFMSMDDYWLVPNKLGKLKVKLYVDYFDRSDEFEYEFIIKDLEAPNICQNEAILPVNATYNILDYVDIIDNVDSLNDMYYEVIGNIDINTPGLYNVDLVVYDQSHNKNCATLYFEVLSKDSELYDLALSFIK